MSKAAMIEAVRALDFRRSKELLNGHPSLIETTDRQGRNLLHIACSAVPADLDVSPAIQRRLVGHLLDCGLEIDTPVGRDHCTALFFAVARARAPSLVEFLIERGARPARAPGGGLFAAAWWDDVRSLELLIGAGAQVDIVVGVTPFLAAWGWKKFKAAKALVLKGANVNFQDRRGKTALHHGVDRQYDPALLKWLVQHGASADIEDNDGVSARARASRKRDKRFSAALASMPRG